MLVIVVQMHVLSVAIVHKNYYGYFILFRNVGVVKSGLRVTGCLPLNSDSCLLTSLFNRGGTDGK